MTPSVSLRRLADKALAENGLSDLPSGHFIHGTFVAGRSGGTIASIDPGTGRPYANFAAGDHDDVADAVASAKEGFTAWRRVPPTERGRVLARAAGLIRERADVLAVAETLDSGKPLSQAAGDVRSAARTFEYYAGAADKLEGESFPLGHDYLGFSVHEPLGVTAHVVPWNYPLSTAARSLAPALAVGCAAVLKPSEETPATALILAAILREAGLPPGAANVVSGTGIEAGAPLVAHPDIRHVTFTGSQPTGTAVMQSAARNVASVTLELGGKSPVVVLADCDFERALEGVASAIFENAGQICSAGSRLIVERGIRDRFLEALIARATSMSIGHGLRDADFGPLASARQLDKVDAIVEAARGRGRDILLGGRRTSDPATGLGFFFEPTIVANLPEDDAVVQEEIFGPVLAVQVAEDAEHAIRLAENTPYGLVGGIYTADIGAALRFARDLSAGQVYVNEYFGGGIEVPFGGTKLSGFGREKGLAAMHVYTSLKSVVARVG